MIINKKKGRRFLLTQPLRSRKDYLLGKIMLAIALVIFVSTAILTVYYWRSLRWYHQILLSFVIYTLSPDIDGLRMLITPYDSYKKEWEMHNTYEQREHSE